MILQEKNSPILERNKDKILFVLRYNIEVYSERFFSLIIQPILREIVYSYQGLSKLNMEEKYGSILFKIAVHHGSSLINFRILG